MSLVAVYTAHSNVAILGQCTVSKHNNKRQFCGQNGGPNSGAVSYKQQYTTVVVTYHRAWLGLHPWEELWWHMNRQAHKPFSTYQHTPSDAKVQNVQSGIAKHWKRFGRCLCLKVRTRNGKCNVQSLSRPFHLPIMFEIVNERWTCI